VKFKSQKQHPDDEDWYKELKVKLAERKHYEDGNSTQSMNHRWLGREFWDNHWRLPLEDYKKQFMEVEKKLSFKALTISEHIRKVEDLLGEEIKIMTRSKKKEKDINHKMKKLNLSKKNKNKNKFEIPNSLPDQYLCLLCQEKPYTHKT